VKILRLAYESERRQRQLDAPSGSILLRIASARLPTCVGACAKAVRKISRASSCIERFRCAAQSQLSLQALIQIADRNARYEHLAEIIAISLINVSYARNRGMCETLGTIPPGAIGFAGLSQGAMNDGERAPTGWQKARSGGLARFGMSLLCRRS
jgi:hypothetical protein